MNDTDPEVERLFHGMLLAKGGAERLWMGADLFAAAREMALAGLRAEGVLDLPGGLFLRLYGEDFAPEERARILGRIRAHRDRDPAG